MSVGEVVGVGVVGSVEAPHGSAGAESAHADPRGRHTGGALHALKAVLPPFHPLKNIQLVSVTADVFQLLRLVLKCLQ